MSAVRDIYQSLQMDSKSAYLNSFLAELDKKFETVCTTNLLSEQKIFG